MTLAPRIVDEQAFLAAKGFRAKAIEWQDKAITTCSHGDIELAEIHRATAQGYQNLAGIQEALAFGLPAPQYELPLGSKPQC